jgi:hypothetical protein
VVIAEHRPGLELRARHQHALHPHPYLPFRDGQQKVIPSTTRSQGFPVHVAHVVNGPDSAEDNERLPATFIYAGIDVEAAGLFAGVRGRQIAGRFTVIGASAFAYGTGEQREQWRALVATMESTLRLHRHKAGSLVALDEYLYRRSGGMIGSLSHLVRGAAVLAIEDGTERITRALLDIVPVDHAAERSAAGDRSRRAIS